MKKLQLQVEALRVDTYETGTTGADARGTVQGNGILADFLAPTQAATCVTCTRPTDPCLCLQPPTG